MQNRNCELITVNNIKLNYCSYGNPENQTVLFIHGYPLDQSMWDNQTQFLENNFRVVTFDIRGFGNSESGDEAYSLPLFASDIVELMKKKGIDKAVLCGFSMGGYIALYTCIHHPELFNGLILHDTQCNGDTPAAREQRAQSIDFIQNNGVKPYAGPFIKKMVAGSSLNNTELVNYLDKTINKQTPGQLCRILQMLADRPETCSLLNTIKIPVLVIRGNEDAIIGEDKVQVLKNGISDCNSVTIDDAGHLSNMEKPEEFNEGIKKFLEGLNHK